MSIWTKKCSRLENSNTTCLGIGKTGRTISLRSFNNKNVVLFSLTFFSHNRLKSKKGYRKTEKLLKFPFFYLEIKDIQRAGKFKIITILDALFFPFLTYFFWISNFSFVDDGDCHLQILTNTHSSEIKGPLTLFK